MKYKVVREFTTYGGGNHEVEVDPIENVSSVEEAIEKLNSREDKLVDSETIPVDISGHYGKLNGSVYSVIGTRCAEWIRLELI